MPVNFPSNPSTNQTYTDGDRTWRYNGIGWQVVANTFFAIPATAVAALDIDCSLGNFFTKSVSTTTTLTVSNVPTGRAYSFTLKIVHVAGGIVWFAGVKWPDSLAPTLTTGRTHLLTFLTDDGGVNWYGSAAPNYIV